MREPPSAPLSDLVLCGLAALCLRLALWSPVAPPDEHRFLGQAADLAAGAGYRCGGGPCTALPPGYPVFLAVLFRLGLPTSAVGVVNAILGAVVCVLLFLLFRSHGRRAAWLAALAWGLHPWLARQGTQGLSEPLSALLATLAALALRPVLMSTRSRTPHAAAGGALLAALALTAPGAVFLCYGAALAVLWSARGRPLTAAAFLAAGAALIAPWQLRAWAVSGTLPPAIVTLDRLAGGPQVWLRSWRIREADLRYAWYPGTLSVAPDRAFADPEQRRRLIELVRSGSRRELEMRLGEVGRRRIAEGPARFAALAALRGVLLWIEMPSLSHLQAEWVGRASPATWRADRRAVGTPGAALRLLKAMAATAAQGLYALWSAALFWLLLRANRHPTPWSLAVAAGVLLYTAASGWTALGEIRRNAPFVPVLISLALPWSPGPRSAAERPRETEG